MLQFESRIYKLTGTTPILGTSPASQAIRTQYVASKAPTPELMEEEIEENSFDLDEKGVTVFNRNRNDELCLMSHQVKGFIKEALEALKPQLKIGNVKKKVDTLISVEPRFIVLKKNGEPLKEEDAMLERPLRAETPKGPRVALQSSEMLEEGWSIEFELTMFPSDGTKMSNPMTFEALETVLDYGMYHGLGQWRGADYGHFVWERVDQDD